MGSFVPNTKKEQEEMLKEAGYSSFEDMLSCIPEEDKLKRPLNLPSGLSEMEAYRKVEEISEKNVVYKSIFRGAGAYNHYIPAIVKSVVSKEGLQTAYTPYQAEISQGVLQSIFEYQTMICELTGMDVANASHYDGSTAAAEAIPMCKDRKRTVAYVSSTVHPGTIQVMKTYCFGSDTEIKVVGAKDGVTDPDELAKAMEDKSACCFVMQQPNFLGNIEDAEKLGEIVHDAGAKFVMSCNPISLAILKTPAECGADICVGDAQPLGMPIAYGGPYVGFMATKSKMMRKLPGRIVGETTDDAGNRAYVLTLQAREQHIRREKASSNICSNEALCALTASCYMAAMGKKGMEQAATLSMSKAHYMKSELEKVGVKGSYDQPFFNEFTTTNEGMSGIISVALEKNGILGGLPVNGDQIIWCTTEMNTKADIDKAVAIVKQALEDGKEAES